MHPETTAQLIPRMGLKHLMLWMFITAAIVGWSMNTSPSRGASEELASLQMMMKLYMSLVAIGVGGFGTAAITLLTACLRHQRIVMHAPGHWIAVSLSLGYLWTALTYLAFMVLADSASANYSILMFAYASGGLLQAIVYLGAWRQQAGSRWRWLFGWAALTEMGSILILAASALTYAMYFPFGGLFSFFRELISLVVIIACLVEALQGVRSDWAHTVSIFGLLIVSLTTYVRVLWVMFLFSR